MEQEKRYNPTEGIWMDFGTYIEQMKRQEQAHRKGGIPDYAFALDYKLREQIRKIPHFHSISAKVMEQQAARYRQIYATSAVQVGPNQFPEIYEMTVDCAKRLGIGIPNIYVYPDQSLNAVTYGGDLVAPTIVLHSGAVERLTPGELKCVIGHECGHVHNEHCVYMMIYNVVEGLTSMTPFPFLSAVNMLLLLNWQRAAEVTSDRAALICCDDPQDAISVNQKLASGAILNQEIDLDVEAIKKQFEDLSAVAAAVTEVYSNHPAAIRRILTSQEFIDCELFYEWRPDLRKPGQSLQTKEEADARCEKYTTLIKERKGGKGA